MHIVLSVLYATGLLSRKMRGIDSTRLMKRDRVSLAAQNYDWRSLYKYCLTAASLLYLQLYTHFEPGGFQSTL